LKRESSAPPPRQEVSKPRRKARRVEQHTNIPGCRESTLRHLAALILIAVVLFPLALAGPVKETFMVPMRDGVRLATDVYLPGGVGPWPVILSRTPYGRFKIDELTNRGYAVVTQDWRGYGGSEGEKLPFEADGWGEHQDGYDTVKWVINQSWCNGKIGTWGGSALGITQNLMAGSHPPGLVCQHILAAADDLYSQMFFQGGVFRKALVESWWGIFGTKKHLTELLSHPNYDSRWKTLNAKEKIPTMTYPGFHVGGWFDIFSQGTIDAFVERQHGGGPGSRGNQRLVIGPWWHGGFSTTAQGDLNFPQSSIYDLWPDTIRFYDHWLKGADNGFEEEPPVRYYVMGDVDNPEAPGNEWRTAADWPLPHRNLSLYLSEEGLARAPGPDGAETYLYDPRDPVPTIGGANLVLPAGPMDQGASESRDDVLVFTSPPLQVPVEITGRVWVQLFADSSCPDTDFMAKLTDVYPDGRSMLILDGALRARHRRSMETDDLLEPGHVYEFWIDLWSTSIVFNEGHRIRVDITSSNYPRFDPNPNTGHPFRSDNETLVARNTIHFGSSYPSRVILPLTGPDQDGDGVPDFLDPLPREPGAVPTREELRSLLDDVQGEISTLGSTDLRSILEGALAVARAHLDAGDGVSAGQILQNVQASIPYDPSHIRLEEARQLVARTLIEARAREAEGRFPEMARCIEAGWKSGRMMENLQGHPAEEIVNPYLLDMGGLMSTRGCHAALRAISFLNQTKVLALAAGIHRARDQGIAEEKLSPIEGMIESAMNQFLNWQVANSNSLLSAAERRLEGVGVGVGESVLLPIMTTLILLVHARPRRVFRPAKTKEPWMQAVRKGQ